MITRATILRAAEPIQRVVFTDSTQGPPAVRSAWTAGAGEEPIGVDRELLERVSSERLAVLIESDRRHAIVAPMMAFGRSTGCVWAETSPEGRLDAAHLRLLLIVMGLAAVAREQSREAARLQESNELLQAEIDLDHNRSTAADNLTE